MDARPVPASLHLQFLLEHLEGSADRGEPLAPHGNFVQVPQAYRGPYEYSVPGAAKDFVPQYEA
jgi:hypothetical protein